MKRTFLEKGINDLVTWCNNNSPKLLLEWSDKNLIDPSNILYSSGKTALWVCSTCGREWEARICRRTKGMGCIKCSAKENGKRLQLKKANNNNFLIKYPEIAAEWHPTKNGNSKPEDFSSGSKEKVWWKCSICGNEWQAAIGNRTARNSLHCKQCNLLYFSTKNNNKHKLFVDYFPEIAAEWHPTKNGDLDPKRFTSGSLSSVWWKCSLCGKEWESKISSRTANGKIGCSRCKRKKSYVPARRIATKNILSDLYPEIAAEWHPTRNGDLKPNEFSVGSGKEIWWKCSLCGKEWSSKIIFRTDTGKSHCKDCKNRENAIELRNRAANRNNFSLQFPEIAKEWHPTKNGDLRPDSFSSKSRYKVWWKCSSCGKEWENRISNRTKSGLPNCADCNSKILAYQRRLNKHKKNNLEELYPEIAAEWHPTKNGALKPYNFSVTSKFNAWWKCKWCGNEWNTLVSYRTTKNTGCPKCGDRHSTSFSEQAVFFYINKFYKDSISRYKYDKNGNEFDIFIPSKNIAIEYDGYFWHQSKSAIERENKKNLYCLSNNIVLYRIRDSRLSKTNNCNVIECIDGNQKSLDESIRALFNALNIPSNNINTTNDAGKILQNYRLNLRDNSLGALYPELIKYWHPTKNNELSPEMISPGSNIKVWWKCPDCGREWQASPMSKTGKDGSFTKCYVCSRPIIYAANRMLIKNVDTGEIFNSITEAAESVNGRKGDISECCKGRQKTAFGYKWEYLEPNKQRKKNIKGRVKNVDTGEVFLNSKEAAKSVNGDSRSINRTCKGITKSYRGYHWEWVDSNLEEQEIKYLEEYYTRGNKEKLMELFPDKTWEQIFYLANSYGFKQNKKALLRDKDISGQKSGKLTALCIDHKEDSIPFWRCRCDCGNDTVIDIYRFGKTKSCGCALNDVPYNAKDHTGEVFGKLTAVERIRKYKGKKTYYRCICECGKEVFVESSRLVSGKKTRCNEHI